MKSKLPNTFKGLKNLNSAEQEDSLINSLKNEPLIIVLRPEKEDWENNKFIDKWLSIVDNINTLGLHHIEIAWFPNRKWVELIESIQKLFPKIHLGAASITSLESLIAVKRIGLEYAMSPFWDAKLIDKSKELNQLLIPGAFSPTEIKKAISYGSRIIKIYPVSSLGINYLSQIKSILPSSIFFIGAGGLTIDDLCPCINSGYDAIAIGRNLSTKKLTYRYLEESFAKLRK